MQYEPRPTIHIENQLGWAHKLRGAESLGISKVGQTVLTRLMEFQIWHQVAGSVGGFLDQRGKEVPEGEQREIKKDTDIDS